MFYFNIFPDYLKIIHKLSIFYIILLFICYLIIILTLNRFMSYQKIYYLFLNSFYIFNNLHYYLSTIKFILNQTILLSFIYKFNLWIIYYHICNINFYIFILILPNYKFYIYGISKLVFFILSLYFILFTSY